MREKNIFFMGLGTGLVIVSIVSLFSYNILKPNNYIDDDKITNISTETTTEIISNETIINKESSIETTTKSLELSSKPNLEITTTKSFGIGS
ncbi:MAG: hypothetical protein ACLUCH_01700 [Lachnospirales bacterium]|nr:hypothetical protein [Clostridiales bacterium]